MDLVDSLPPQWRQGMPLGAIMRIKAPRKLLFQSSYDIVHCRLGLIKKSHVTVLASSVWCLRTMMPEHQRHRRPAIQRGRATSGGQSSSLAAIVSTFYRRRSRCSTAWKRPEMPPTVVSQC